MPDPDTVSLPDAFLGVFWGIRGAGEFRLVADRTHLTEAEPYGDFLTHPRGHYEIWEEWLRLSPAGLAKHGLPGAIAWTEYEDHPRGRVVYHLPTRRFIVYADRKLHHVGFIARLTTTLQIPAGTYDPHTDPHYITH